MSTQKHLFPTGPALGNLSQNEEFIFTLLQASPNGLSAFDIGRSYHIEGPYACRTCNEQRTCEFAKPNAVRILKQLRRRDCVIERRGIGRWVALVPAERDTGELPDGF